MAAQGYELETSGLKHLSNDARVRVGGQDATCAPTRVGLCERGDGGALTHPLHTRPLLSPPAPTAPRPGQEGQQV